MSSLKLEHAGLQPWPVPHELESPQKTYDRSVTAETFHVLMSPYVASAAVRLSHHASRAVSSAVRFSNIVPPGECIKR